MTASLLTKDALSKLPADLRDHIIVENENLYGITLHMSIGDFERLVAPHDLLDQMRDSLDEAERRVQYAEQAADDAEQAADDADFAAEEATRERDLIAKAVQTYIAVTVEDEWPDGSPQAAALAALEDLL